MALPNATCAVVIPCFNGEPFLEATVASVRQQAFSDYHLVLVDDASTDGTLALARRIAENQPNTTVVALPENRGRCHARNQGALATTGKYITFLDQDDSYHPEFLVRTVEALDQYVQYDAIKVLPSLSVSIDNVRYEAIANSLATTTIFRRPAFEFIGGWPESEIFRHHPGGCEDIALLNLFNTCFVLGVLHGQLYNYTLRPGNALDLFLKRSSVIDGVLHVASRDEKDELIDAETNRLRDLLKIRIRETLQKWPAGLVALQSETNPATASQ